MSRAFPPLPSCRWPSPPWSMPRRRRSCAARRTCGKSAGTALVFGALLLVPVLHAMGHQRLAVAGDHLDHPVAAGPHLDEEGHLMAADRLVHGQLMVPD